MWFDEIPPGRTWASLWHGYIVCGRCSGIRRVTEACPGCGDGAISCEERPVRLEDGREILVRPVFAGAEGRYEDWVYVKMIEREWKRPVPVIEEQGTPESPSPRAAVVLLFWTYFETRIERLLRGAMHNVPTGLANDTLKRYSTIGTRLHQLYRVLFDTTYFKDVEAAGFPDVAEYLERVHGQRNEFAHGHPGAITEELVISVVRMLQREHEAWIAVFNKRSTRLAPR